MHFSKSTTTQGQAKKTQGRARQDRARQDKTRRNKKRQDATRQDTTRRGKTRRRKTKQDLQTQDWARQTNTRHGLHSPASLAFFFFLKRAGALTTKSKELVYLLVSAPCAHPWALTSFEPHPLQLNFVAILLQHAVPKRSVLICLKQLYEEAVYRNENKTPQRRSPVGERPCGHMVFIPQNVVLKTVAPDR